MVVVLKDRTVVTTDGMRDVDGSHGNAFERKRYGRQCYRSVP